MARLRGGDPGPDADALETLVGRALADGDPLPGTGGFAGALDGTLVRDVLGRVPLFSEANAPPDDSHAWAHDPDALESPRRVPAGHALAPGDRDPHRVWSLPDPPAATDEAAALDAVERAVVESVRAVDDEGLAVAFSGGVDSAIVAAGVPDAPCYVAGFEGAHDVAAARAAADAMDRELRVVDLDHAALERAVPEIAAATGRTNAMDVQIALPLYLVAERVAADGFDRLAVGQGADELFGGYAKVVDPAGDHRVAADTVRGARRETLLTLPDQLERDVLTLRAAGVDPVVPLLHDRVVAAALPLPGSLLATEAERKVALRRAAEGLVPEPVRTTEKKAAQYGSYAARELDRLARRAGFKRRMDNHVDRYVDSLVAEAGVEVPAIDAA
ncbi:MAG: asparagine synthase C-terminal domain-containing protein [Haloferacaceae archaeon]